MDGHSLLEHTGRSNISDEEWRVRVELAAVYRLIHHYGWDELIYNHAAARVLDDPGKFLIKRHELLYDEVTASNLVKVDIGDDLDERHGVNRPGFTLHSGIMMSRPDVHCSVHVHTVHGAALAALPSGLRMVTQAAMRFYGRIGYHEFEGITDSFDERDRIVRDLADHRVLIMRYHGLLSVGAHCTQAFNTMRHLITAIEGQLMAEATGQKLVDVAPELCAQTARQVEEGEKRRKNDDMQAYMRILDKIDPGYRS